VINKTVFITTDNLFIITRNFARNSFSYR